MGWEFDDLAGGILMKKEKQTLSKELKKGFIESEKYKTYYEIHSPNCPKNNATPIILLAGGPGLSFKTLTPLLNLAETRPVIAYDQIGSGKSTRSESFM